MATLNEMEKHLTKIYGEAQQGLSKKWNDYMAKANKELKSLQDKLKEAQKSGDPTEIKTATYNLQNATKEITIMDERYRDMVKQTADRYADVNKIALKYVNGEMANIYTIHYNNAGNAIEKSVKGYAFDLVDESTVKRLANEGKIILPAKALDNKKDTNWNVKQINSQLMQGILQGESIPDIAKRLQNVTNQNLASSLRNARTMATSAENSGRLDSYKQASKDGVIMKKVWMAAHDDRTRESHVDLDGEAVDVDDAFSNGLMYPGDPSGDPEEVYNCRCTIHTKILGFKSVSEPIQWNNDNYQDKTFKQLFKEMEKNDDYENSQELWRTLTGGDYTVPAQANWEKYLNGELPAEQSNKIDSILQSYEGVEVATPEKTSFEVPERDENGLLNVDGDELTNEEKNMIVSEELNIDKEEAEKYREALDNWNAEGGEYKMAQILEEKRDKQYGPYTEWAHLTEDYIDKAPKYTGEMYRGLSFDNPEQAEKVLELARNNDPKAFNEDHTTISWSTKESLVNEIYTEQNAIIFVCEDGNSKSTTISQFNGGEYYSEVIASRDAEWNYLRDETRNGVTYIYVSENKPAAEEKLVEVSHMTKAENAEKILKEGFDLSKAGETAGDIWGGGAYFTTGETEKQFYSYRSGSEEITATVNTSGMLEVNIEGSVSKPKDMYNTAAKSFTDDEQKTYKKLVKEYKKEEINPEQKAFVEIASKNYPGIVIKQTGTKGIDPLTGGNQIVVFNTKRIKNISGGKKK